MIFVSDVLIILVCIAISYFVLNYHRRQSSKTVNTLPGPRTLPFIRNAHVLLHRNPNDMLNIFTKWTEDYPSPFRMWMGNKLFIFINKPDQIKMTTEEGKALAEELGCPFYETSAALRQFVDDAFFSLVRQIRAKERSRNSHRKRSRWWRIRPIFAFIFRRKQRHALHYSP